MLAKRVVPEACAARDTDFGAVFSDPRTNPSPSALVVAVTRPSKAQS